ncbi:MAG: ABC transporter ATP-binding protein/permease [Pseudomonadota bacterium]
MRQLGPYIWPWERPDLKRRVLLALVALLLAKIVTVLVPYSYKWAVDSFSAERPGDIAGLPAWMLVPVFLVIAYALGRIMMVGFMQLRDGLFAKVSLYAVRQLAIETFRHLHSLSLRFHLERRTGGLSRVIERGIKGIETINRYVILSMVPTIVEFGFMLLIFGLEFDWRYVAVLIMTVVAYVWFTFKVSDWRIGIRRVMNDSDTDANSKAIDSLLNFETVKYFGNEEMEARRFDRSMERYQGASIRMWESLSWLNFGQAVIFTAGMLAVMLMAAQGVQSGENTVGDFVLVNALMIQLYQPLNFIGFVYREIRQGLVDIEAMFTTLRKQPEVQDAPGAAPLSVGEGAIRFEDVHFSYDVDRPILRGISFDVPAGQTVALVGPSGAGKSTISRLLFRFYEPKAGRILVDDQDINGVQQASLRAIIGMVPQDTVLFNDTIRYNIAYGRPDATDDDIAEAARLAQIDDFIATLPKGFDTEVGERGLKLSGGEKQRVAIARTLLKAPPILMLDEATSALDSFTEREIQSALDFVSKDRTTLVIAHRLSTVINADRILVIQEGQIVEEGSHDELLERGGLYAGMWTRQREADEVAEQFREVQDDKSGFITIGQKTPRDLQRGN